MLMYVVANFDEALSEIIFCLYLAEDLEGAVDITRVDLSAD